MEKLNQTEREIAAISGQKLEDYKLPSAWQLEMRLKKLSYLALHLNPYTGVPTDQTLLNLVQEFDLYTHLENPFSFTNQLLSMIDQTETTLKSIRA